MIIRPSLFIFASVLSAAEPLNAQSVPPAGAAGALAPLTEISVLGERTRGRSIATTDRAGPAQIGNLDPGTVSEILRLAPAAHIQTNSRGETLVFLRNAGERQVAVFYDGALVNVPWDNRVDLSLIPAAAIGGLTVAKGPTSVEYGANVIGGAVNVTTRNPGGEHETGVHVRRGDAGLWDLSIDHAARLGRVGLIAGADYRKLDGIPLPDGADLPFNQIGEETRTNTDSEFFNLFLRAGTTVGEETDLGASVFYVDGEKGVAPEGNVAPQDGPRLWRLPQWEMLMAILSGEGRLGGAARWKGTLWLQSFDQTIDSFETLAFDVRDGRQEDDNLTFGSRFILTRDIGPHRLVYSFNGLVSEHDQRDTPFVEGVPEAGESLDLAFRQWTLSNGLELELALADRLDATLGAGIDLMTAPKTGDKPPISDFVVWNLTGGLAWQVGERWRLRASAGRKTRLPTLRELFGQALNRFLVNPDLKPESAALAEIGLAYEGTRASFAFVPFVNYTADTIDQRNVTIDGRRLRQRVNLKGSRILGIEASGGIDIAPELRLDGHVTVMDTDRRPGFPGDFTRLEEKPEIIARGALAYTPDRGLRASAEVVHTGRAFSLTDADDFVPLNVSTALNLRLAYEFGDLLPGLDGAELYLRVDNVTDSVIEPQAGLPGAGRWISGGLKARF